MLLVQHNHVGGRAARNLVEHATGYGGHVERQVLFTRMNSNGHERERVAGRHCIQSLSSRPHSLIPSTVLIPTSPLCINRTHPPLRDCGFPVQLGLSRVGRAGARYCTPLLRNEGMTDIVKVKVSMPALVLVAMQCKRFSSPALHMKCCSEEKSHSHAHAHTHGKLEWLAWTTCDNMQVNS